MEQSCIVPVYQGIDTLDVAVKGAASRDVLDALADARQRSEAVPNNTYGTSIKLGQADHEFVVKAHGKRGGYRYTVVDVETGTILSVKEDQRETRWNLFVSARAHTLLSRGYEGTKAEISDCLSALGVQTPEYSVNRIDHAFDIVATDFELDPAQFVTPARCKVRQHFNSNQHLDQYGEPAEKAVSSVPVGSVLRGGRFESVTIGKMPGRQIIVYDKTAAAKVLRTPYWFDAWGIDPDDNSKRVWRVEVRAGRDSWSKHQGPLGHRTFESIEALLPKFIAGALQDIRYVTNRSNTSNVTRAELHPLWRAAQKAVEGLAKPQNPPLTPDYVRELMRKQRRDMAMAQGFGNLNNLMVLEGHDVEEITRRYPQMVADHARAYVDQVGADGHAKKLEGIIERQAAFLRQDRC